MLLSAPCTYLALREHILQCYIRKSTRTILHRRKIRVMEGVFRLSETEDESKMFHLAKIIKENKRKHVNYKSIGGASAFVNNNDGILLEENFHLDPLGSVSTILSSDCLAWQPLENMQGTETICCWTFLNNEETSNCLELSEIYGVKLGSMGSFDQDKSATGVNGVYHFTVFACTNSPNRKGTWIPMAFTFFHTNKEVCERWANQLQSLTERDRKRPKNLLVIINPHSGKKTALKTWKEVSSLFEQANINTKVLETVRVRHAFEVLNRASDDELSKLDGVVIVGGDGLFNEVLNGLLLRRHRAKYPPKPQSTRVKETSADSSTCMDDITMKNTGSNDSNNSNYILLSGSEDNHIENHTLNSPMRCNEFTSAVNDESIYYKDGGFVMQSVSCSDGSGETSREGDPSNSAFVFPNETFRIGIIPAGSTDSIAVSTTGSRDAATCSLHIILGESMPLDIVRLLSWKSRSTSTEELPRIRYAASFAGYGFYGDIIKESEPHRWMGPMRYDYAGTKVFAQHKLYEAEVSFIEIPERNTSTSSSNNLQKGSPLNQTRMKERLGKMICGSNCSICMNGFDFSEIDERSLLSMYPSEKGSRWKHSKGSFISIGAAVMSCRNDKAPNGVAANAHLADGLMHLILIKNCSRLAYLWHLIQLTREDGHPLDFEFIEVYKTPQFNFISEGEESIWNVDGEILPAHRLSAQVFRGLINIFASGPIV